MNQTQVWNSSDTTSRDRMTITEDHMTIIEGHMTIREGHMTTTEDRKDIIEGHMDIIEHYQTIMEDHMDSIGGHMTTTEGRGADTTVQGVEERAEEGGSFTPSWRKGETCINVPAAPLRPTPTHPTVGVLRTPDTASQCPLHHTIRDSSWPSLL